MIKVIERGKISKDDLRMYQALKAENEQLKLYIKNIKRQICNTIKANCRLTYGGE